MGSTVFPAAGGGVTQKVQEFTSTGTFTVPSNCSAVEVFLVGGGGGGGCVQNGSNRASAGGGGGAVISQTLTVTPGASYTVTVGAGGSGGTNPAAPGSDGGDTSFGSLLIAYGGGGGGSLDSNGSAILPRMRGTQGGTAINATQNMGGSGAQRDFGFPQTSTTPFVVNTDRYSSINGVRQGGWSFAQSSISVANNGVNGYGGGGGGGYFASPISNYFNRVSVDGGGLGAQNSAATNGGDGTANKGGGGGGATTTGGATANGGNGGSGYVRVTYWS